VKDRLFPVSQPPKQERKLPQPKKQVIARTKETTSQSSARRTFTTEQRKILEVIYRKGKFRSPECQKLINIITQLTMKKIKQWFQNRKKRAKRTNEREPTEDNPLPLRDSERSRPGRKGFNEFQHEVLNLAYEGKVLDDSSLHPLLAEVIDLTVKQVRQWRQNRKKREKGTRQPRKKATPKPRKIAKKEGQKIKLEFPDSKINPGMPLNLFHPSRIQPPEGIITEGLDNSFKCCGCALGTKDVISCTKCIAKFHILCLKHIFCDSPEPESKWECPICDPSRFTSEPLMSHVSNTRGQYYYKGQRVKAIDRNTGAVTDSTVFIVGRDSILLHFNNWSNVFNQWIPSNNPKVEPAAKVPPPKPLTPRPSSKRGITALGRAGRADSKKRKQEKRKANTINAMSLLKPFQQEVLQRAMLVGTLDISNPVSHDLMAKYIGVHKEIVSNFVLQR